MKLYQKKKHNLFLFPNKIKIENYAANVMPEKCINFSEENFPLNHRAALSATTTTSSIDHSSQTNIASSLIGVLFAALFKIRYIRQNRFGKY